MIFGDWGYNTGWFNEYVLLLVIINNSSFVIFSFNNALLLLFQCDCNFWLTNCINFHKSFLVLIIHHYLTTCRDFIIFSISFSKNRVINFWLSHVHSSGRWTFIKFVIRFLRFTIINTSNKSSVLLKLLWLFGWRCLRLFFLIWTLNGVTHNTFLSLGFGLFRCRTFAIIHTNGTFFPWQAWYYFWLRLVIIF